MDLIKPYGRKATKWLAGNAPVGLQPWVVGAQGFLYSLCWGSFFCQIYGCFLKWWVYPHFTQLSTDHFLVGKAMVVGETHHFRKPLHCQKGFWCTSFGSIFLSKLGDLSNQAVDPWK